MNAATTATLAPGTLDLGQTNADASATGRWLLVVLVLVVAGLFSAFYAINEYSSSTAAIIKSSATNSQRFETIYRDSAETKINTLRLGISIVLENSEIISAFVKDDRPALVAKVLPFYKETLKPRYAIDQFNFWTPPAMLYLRSSDPKSFAVDGSTFRQTVVEAHKKRIELGGMETGLGGLIGLRAMAPVLDGTRLVGVVEFGTDISDLLKRASGTTGLDFAVGLSQQRSEIVQRPTDAAVDSIQGTDVFYIYSRSEAKQMVRSMSFNPRSPEVQLVEVGGRTIFVRPFVLINYSGVPTVVVATLLDLTDDFAKVFRTVAVKTAVLFLLSSLIVLIGIFKFRQMKRILNKAISSQRVELEEKAAFCEAAVAKLREVDLIKRGFFTNLVIAVNEPLQSVAGTLQSITPVIEAAAKTSPTGAQVLDRLRFAHAETSRLSRLIGDYQQIELFRQKLVKGDSPLLGLAGVVERALAEDLALYQRLPQLKISTDVPASLPVVRADPDLLRRAVSGLVAYAARGAGQGKIHLSGEVDSSGWLKLSITGSAFASAGAPTEALLDETRQFLSRLATEHAATDTGGSLIPLVLARTIIEYYGGSVEASPADKANPGFVVRLPKAV